MWYEGSFLWLCFLGETLEWKGIGERFRQHPNGGKNLKLNGRLAGRRIKRRINSYSRDSEHISINETLFDNLEKGKFDVIKTGKQNTLFPVRGKGDLGKNTISLHNCLLVPNIVINLIRTGELATRGCILLAHNLNFSVSKNSCIYFDVKGNNGLFIVKNSDYIGNKPGPSATLTREKETLMETHEKLGLASIQRIE
ncbi:hypothetical protein VP01_1975g1 [Puccinia sorghi]|uniref:Uncharacterized protein n=1 Tax=Puccinia sorghi TaxID=27349 RepID=A0A0L6VBT4_9BASI|nr:hypothetical protein VP01_1975g1 [Puccinia sorghi]